MEVRIRGKRCAVVCACMNVHAGMFICVSACVCMQACGHVHVACACMRICARMQVCIYVCAVRAYRSVFLCTLYVHACLFARMCVM